MSGQNHAVIPVKTEIHFSSGRQRIPAFAGMTFYFFGIRIGYQEETAIFKTALHCVVF